MTQPPRQGSYDEVLYPGYPYAQTHPDRLATLGTLFGMNPAPVDRCRVLEIGCGNGANLIPMAHGLPGSEFVGFDLAARPIEKGREMIAALGLTNITLSRMDIMAATADLGSFDYIIAHGIYSWVAPEIRDKIMAICAAHLTPRGIAYISYNAYPGGHLRDMGREMMLFHTRGITEPDQKVRQACALLHFITESRPERNAYRGLLHDMLEGITARVSSHGPAPFYHDALEEFNEPMYFWRFMEHAERHGLQFLAEANFSSMKDDIFSPEVNELLRGFSGDIVAKEQYLDFLNGRQFRQTLLCRADVPLDRSEGVLERVPQLRAASSAKPEPAEVTSDLLSAEEFRGPRRETVKTSHPLAKAALLHLGELWPQSVSFEELLAAARARVGSRGNEEESSASTLAKILWGGYCTGLVELHAQVPRLAVKVSERPEASSVARLQSQSQPTVTNLCHQRVLIDGVIAQRLLVLLDGTRDRDALLEELRPLVKSGEATLLKEGKPVTDVTEALKILADELDPHLERLARLALLAA